MTYHNLSINDLDFLRENCPELSKDMGLCNWFKKQPNQHIENIIKEAKKELEITNQAKRKEEIVFLEYLKTNIL